MIDLPDDDGEIIRIARDLIDICRDNAQARMNTWRFYDQMAKAGSRDGVKSLVNVLYTALDRLASHLFSPTDLRFGMEFASVHDKMTEARGARAARLVAESWSGANTDILFSKGVFEALKYGLMIMKQTVRETGEDKIPAYRSMLVKPWQFGVYRPDIANLEDQACLVETIPMTLPEVWRRIYRLPRAKQMFEQIKASAGRNPGLEVSGNFTHPVVFANQIQSTQTTKILPGGVVSLAQNATLDGVSARLVAPSVLFHELWVWCGDDYVTIQIIEANGDILIAPTMKRCNLLVPGAQSGLHPYSMIQPNSEDSNIWGRSELEDLINPQQWATETAEDMRRLFAVQVEKVLAFTGDGLTDETYVNARNAGYLNLGPGGGVNDLTPKFPGEAIPMLDKILQLMDMIAGFDNLLSGRAEGSVRSGVQASPMMKVAGSRLKDRSLEVERQCAIAADLRFSLMQYKDGRNYWLDPEKPEETKFILAEVPDDARIVVDGHTTSPIFADENANLILNGLRLGIVDKTSAIEMLPFQNKDVLLQRIKEASEQQQKMLADLKQQDPEGYRKMLEKQMTHSGRR